jgi:hypothetical protein
MCAQPSIPSRRALVKGASAAAAVSVLGLVPGLPAFAQEAEAPAAEAAASEWMEVEDANGKMCVRPAPPRPARSPY